jgi:hypothetical protein
MLAFAIFVGFNPYIRSSLVFNSDCGNVSGEFQVMNIIRTHHAAESVNS